LTPRSEYEPPTIQDRMTASSYSEQHDARAPPPRRIDVPIRPYTGMSERQSRLTFEEHSVVQWRLVSTDLKKIDSCDSAQSNQ
jgi:hypothetical protein